MAVKYDYKYLTEYCKQHNIILNKDYSKDIIKFSTPIKARCLGENCNVVIEKQFRRICVTGCYCKTHTELLRREKMKNTCFEKYGVESPFLFKEFKEKSKQTLLKNYGVENPFQSEEIKDKCKKTCLNNYGVEHAFQSEEVRDRTKKTCLEKYGVENASQSEQIKKKKKKLV